MTIESKTITLYTCDRCGKSTSLGSETALLSDWCSMSFQTLNGGTLAGRYKLEDVCDDCTNSFEEWLKNAQGS